MGLWEVKKRYMWSLSNLIFDLCSRYDVFIYVTLGNILRSKTFIKKSENIVKYKKNITLSHFLEIITVVSSYQSPSPVSPFQGLHSSSLTSLPKTSCVLTNPCYRLCFWRELELRELVPEVALDRERQGRILRSHTLQTPPEGPYCWVWASWRWALACDSRDPQGTDQDVAQVEGETRVYMVCVGTWGSFMGTQAMVITRAVRLADFY